MAGRGITGKTDPCRSMLSQFMFVHRPARQQHPTYCRDGKDGQDDGQTLRIMDTSSF